MIGTSSPFLRAKLSLAILVVAALPLQAVDYDITISDDNDTTNGDCSLREAIHAATHNVARDACPAGSPSTTDHITLYASVTFDDGNYYVNNVQGGELVISGATADPTDSVINLFWSNRFLFLANADPVTVKNVEILFGEADSTGYGGIIRCLGSSLTLDNVIFGLSTAGYGGAVSFVTISGDHRLLITDSHLSGNGVDSEADSVGGGLYVDVTGTTEVQIVDSTISDNTQTQTGPQPGAGAGAWFSARENASVTIAGSLFDNNSGDTDTYNDGGGLYLEMEGTASADIRDTTFSNNHWDYDAPTGWDGTDGAYLNPTGNSSLVVDRCTFTDNHSPNADKPDQLYLAVQDNAVGIVASSLFTGGAWAINGFSNSTSDAYLTHLTMTGNENSIHFTRIGSANAELSNSILALNNSDGPTLSGGTLDMNNFVGGDPLFVGGGDYRLQGTSTAINSGDWTRPGVRNFDLDHGPRVVGSETDQGAYEWGGIFADDFETGDTSAWH